MMSQTSHTKSITQINYTIESHEMGHMWDDVMHKIQIIMAPGNSWNYRQWEEENMHKNCQLTRKGA